MKVLILTLGTRGDIQPFVALAGELTRAGHDAVLAAPHRFAGFATAQGVSFAGIDDGPLALLDSGSPVGDVAAGGQRAKVALARKLPAMYEKVLQDCWTVASTGPGAGADVVVHNGQVIAGQHVAEKLKVPAVLALPIPLYVPTREFPWPGADLPHNLPGVLNRASYLGMKGPALMFGRTVDRWRAETLGLGRRRGRHNPVLTPGGQSATVFHAVSRHVLPRPADWPATADMTGYWFLDAEPTTLPDDLHGFLDDGEPPVFIGFGSMAGLDPAATTSLVLQAVERAGVRAVIGRGSGGLSPTAAQDGVFVVDEVPYDLLFPKVAAIVHHGGAGTVASAVAAGRPQVICPFVADQPFWGRLMQSRGVATAPINQRRLTVDSLTEALTQAVTDTALAKTASDLGALVRAERGTREAVHRLGDLITASAR